ncbi:hypothetical protein BgiMline_002939 [Biomphalaria glabrata]
MRYTLQSVSRKRNVGPRDFRQGAKDESAATMLVVRYHICMRPPPADHYVSDIGQFVNAYNYVHKLSSAIVML